MPEIEVRIVQLAMRPGLTEGQICDAISSILSEYGVEGPNSGLLDWAYVMDGDAPRRQIVTVPEPYTEGDFLGAPSVAMTSYRVTVTRDTTESTVVEIEATSPEEADTAALDQAILHGHKLVWTLDEGNALNHSPYIGDPGNAEARPSEEEKSV